MQIAGVKRKGANPGGTEEVLLAQNEIHVVGVPVGSGGGKRRLLNQKVVGCVVVDGGAQKPLRTGGLRPIEAGGCQIIAEGDRNVVGYGNGTHAGNEAL